ncbi:hypothetical protein [Bosea sp. 685]|uniref:hypothetical protein n=1 Tax=Bosea sp. 685 TaxID=3080057 RepID=UPI0028931A47|nr:hypothetical protein [Bosea sp. 685]WNJ92405.1 hypothetical protein RMR04_08960 [Bosea sp. 685]
MGRSAGFRALGGPKQNRRSASLFRSGRRMAAMPEVMSPIILLNSDCRFKLAS